jgi:ABC-type tungstate transport system permease subunit
MQYPQFPVGALTAASLLQVYTLSDRGTFLTVQSQNKSIADNLVLYRRGEDTDPADPLLNPAAVLLGARVCAQNFKLAQNFVTWMVDPAGGQAVVKVFHEPGTTEVLYTMAPDCKTEPQKCVGY